MILEEGGFVTAVRYLTLVITLLYHKVSTLQYGTYLTMLLINWAVNVRLHP